LEEVAEKEKICEEGAKRCLDNNLQECRNNEWITIEICEYGCDNSTLTCKSKPGEKPEEIQKEPKEEVKPEQPSYILILLVIVAICALGGLLYYFKIYRKKIKF